MSEALALSRRSALLAAVAALAGCASGSKRVYLPLRAFMTPPVGTDQFERLVSLPPLAEDAVVGVGESMVSRAAVVQRKRYTLNAGAKGADEYDEGVMVIASVPRGPLTLAGVDGAGGRYYRSAGWIALEYVSKGKTDQGNHRLDGGIHLSKSDDASVYFFWEGYRQPVILAAQTPPSIEVSQVESSAAPSFRRELVYSGRSQQTINVTYREFAGDMARPAFTQSLQYDLGVGGVIGFKGARFQVLSADNTSIRYRVIQALD